jgi:hypothetical protein
MDGLRLESKKGKDAQEKKSGADLFNEAAVIYCQLTGVGAKFKDAQGNEQGCK